MGYYCQAFFLKTYNHNKFNWTSVGWARKLMAICKLKVKGSMLIDSVVSNWRSLKSSTEWEGDCRGDGSLQSCILLHAHPFASAPLEVDARLAHKLHDKGIRKWGDLWDSHAPNWRPMTKVCQGKSFSINEK